MQSRRMRSISYVLIVALLLSIAPMPIHPKANAQLMPQYSVGVVDFVNESGVQGDLLARLATDSVVVEMGKTNRYDVSTTRSQLKEQMEALDLHFPLDKVSLVRLGEALSLDSMVEGAITSVQVAGSGATRRASVTMVVQMIDIASGEVINGAVQTGTSSARVGSTPDDDSLILEAINKAAFLSVKTMVDYIVPEATIQMNIGEDQVMLNRGARDGMKPGMRMIVLRNKEIIGYIELRTVSAIDSIAKVVKSMRGIQPEDKARAIFDMPTVRIASEKAAPLPSGAPDHGKAKSSAFSKVGKFLVGAAIVFGLVSLFKGGRGVEDGPTISGVKPMEVSWDPTDYNHYREVRELQVVRDEFGDDARPLVVITDQGLMDFGKVNLYSVYGGAPRNAISYRKLDTNPTTTTPTPASWDFPGEPYGQQHSYQVRVIYAKTSGGTIDEEEDDDGTTKWFMTPVGNIIKSTAIRPIRVADVLQPFSDGSVPELDISEMLAGTANLQWSPTAGADEYFVKVEPIVPNTAPTWDSRTIGRIFAQGTIVELPPALRQSLANSLANYSGQVMKWVVYCRNSTDTNSIQYDSMIDDIWYKGEENRFEVGSIPPPPPL